jgi:hypothetical protein
VQWTCQPTKVNGAKNKPVAFMRMTGSGSAPELDPKITVTAIPVMSTLAGSKDSSDDKPSECDACAQTEEHNVFSPSDFLRIH